MLKHGKSSSPIDTMTLRENRIARIAELLGVPVDVIRAYGKPQRRVVFRVARRRVGTVVEVEPPPARLMTLKTDANTAPAKEIATSDENELFRKWREASNEAKPELQKRLYHAVLKHARAVIWQQLEEQNPDLAQNIATAVIMRLSTFRQKSKFSTWVQGIANNQIKQELRRRKRSRRVFDEYSDVFELVGDEKELTDPKASAAVLEMEDRRVREGLRKQVSAEEYFLLECMCERVSTAGIAERLKITDDAVESRCRRLKKKLQKIYSTRRNGK